MRWGRASPFFWPNHTYFLPLVYISVLGPRLTKAVTRINGAINGKCIPKMSGHFLRPSSGDIYCFAICSNTLHLSFMQYSVINISLSLPSARPASLHAVLHGLFMSNFNMFSSHADQFLMRYCTVLDGCLRGDSIRVTSASLSMRSWIISFRFINNVVTHITIRRTTCNYMHQNLIWILFLICFSICMMSYGHMWIFALTFIPSHWFCIQVGHYFSGALAQS